MLLHCSLFVLLLVGVVWLSRQASAQSVQINPQARSCSFADDATGIIIFPSFINFYAIYLLVNIRLLCDMAHELLWLRQLRAHIPQLPNICELLDRSRLWIALTGASAGREPEHDGVGNTGQALSELATTEEFDVGNVDQPKRGLLRRITRGYVASPRVVADRMQGMDGECHEWESF